MWSPHLPANGSFCFTMTLRRAFAKYQRKRHKGQLTECDGPRAIFRNSKRLFVIGSMFRNFDESKAKGTDLPHEMAPVRSVTCTFSDPLPWRQYRKVRRPVLEQLPAVLEKQKALTSGLYYRVVKDGLIVKMLETGRGQRWAGYKDLKGGLLPNTR
jgi:hypothetical protein